jgi:hypothetical protein
MSEQPRFTDYKDNEKRKAVLEKLPKCQGDAEAFALIDEYYSGWLILMIDDYSPDYPHLRRNWEFICNKLNTVPQKIALAQEIHFDQDHSILNKLGDYITQKGYCLRRIEEFIVCPTCVKAIPCRDIWQLMRDKKISCPAVWRNHCIHCL